VLAQDDVFDTSGSPRQRNELRMTKNVRSCNPRQWGASNNRLLLPRVERVATIPCRSFIAHVPPFVFLVCPPLPAAPCRESVVSIRLTNTSTAEHSRRPKDLSTWRRLALRPFWTYGKMVKGRPEKRCLPLPWACTTTLVPISRQRSYTEKAEPLIILDRVPPEPIPKSRRLSLFCVTSLTANWDKSGETSRNPSRQPAGPTRSRSDSLPLHSGLLLSPSRLPTEGFASSLRGIVPVAHYSRTLSWVKGVIPLGTYGVKFQIEPTDIFTFCLLFSLVNASV
jgi:hypothetical protein